MTESLNSANYLVVGYLCVGPSQYRRTCGAPVILRPDVLERSDKGVYYCGGMPFAQLQYTKGQVNRAGETLITMPELLEELYNRPLVAPDQFAAEESTLWDTYDQALTIIGNWRSSHSLPLHHMKMTLKARAVKIDSRALVGQRLKRLPSIQGKLERALRERGEKMQLARMQDIGGCRAVVQTIGHVDRLVQVYAESFAKNPNVRSQFVRASDYITSPKTDGYRSVHLIYKYRSPSPARQAWNGTSIEIQIRSRPQHAWATAVETVSTFTDQALKSGIGKDEWKRFFAVMSSAIALRERRPPVPGTPTTEQELKKELRDLAKELQVIRLLQGWKAAMRHIWSKTTDARAFLLRLDQGTNVVTVTGFKSAEMLQAQDRYLREEKETADDPQIQVVLVSVGSVHALRVAYPSYFVDTDAFIRELSLIIGQIPSGVPASSKRDR